MITIGCQKCDEKIRDADDLTILCDKHYLECLEAAALTAINQYLNEGLTGDEKDYNYRKAKWAQRRARLAGLLNQIELDDRKESEVQI